MRDHISSIVSFVNLSPGRTYTVFFVGTNDNPSIQAISSKIGYLLVDTKNIAYTANIHSCRLIYSQIILGILIYFVF